MMCTIVRGRIRFCKTCIIYSLSIYLLENYYLLYIDTFRRVLNNFGLENFKLLN